MEPNDRVLVEDRNGVLHSISMGSPHDDGDGAYRVLTIAASAPGAPELELIVEAGSTDDALRAMFAG